MKRFLKSISFDWNINSMSIYKVEKDIFIAFSSFFWLIDPVQLLLWLMSHFLDERQEHGFFSSILWEDLSRRMGQILLHDLSSYTGLKLYFTRSGSTNCGELRQGRISLPKPFLYMWSVEENSDPSCPIGCTVIGWARYQVQEMPARNLRRADCIAVLWPFGDCAQVLLYNRIIFLMTLNHSEIWICTRSASIHEWWAH